MGDTVAVLIAFGANEIAIPCRLFEDMDKGVAFCDEIFEMKGELLDENRVLYQIDLAEFASTEKTERNEKISRTLFTRHYYGCGGPGPFVLKRIPFNEAFVGFDLD